MVHVLIVEDDAATRAQLANRVASIAGLHLQAAVGSLREARQHLLRQRPDVVLLDLELEDGHGTELITELRARDADLPILVISVFGDERSVIEAIRAGARGYLQKDDDSSEVGDAISQVLLGGSPISPGIARHLVNQYQTPAAAGEQQVTLSARELEVLNLAARGYTYRESAALLGVSVNTVSTYTRRVYEKLCVNSRSAAVFEAQRSGLMRQGP